MAEGFTAPIPERLVGERIAGRFVIERLIGHGPLSTAFRAHDERLHRRVTVKLFHPRHRDDVHVVEAQLESARSVARLSHENIALVIDRGEHEGMPLVVLEYVRGENLMERMDRYAPLGAVEVVSYGVQLARALTYAHGHGVVHGNLRPENVLLTEDRDVKLVDFGGGSYVAQLVGDPYAAPDLRELDPGAPPEVADDIYALGAVLFAALTEQTAPPGITAVDVQLARPDVSARLASSIARSLAEDPADRHGSMRELAAELAAVRDGAPRAMAGSGAAATTQAFEVVDPRRAQRPTQLSDPDDDWSSSDEPHAVDSDRARRADRARTRRAAAAARSPHQTRARILAWSIVLVPIAALIVVGIMLAGERGEDQVDGNSGQGAVATADVVPVRVVSFDPEGDKVEHPDDVALAIDDDVETSWDTEGYDTPQLAGGKPGVGLVLELPGPIDVRDVIIVTSLPGWTMQVRMADELAPTLDGWTPVSEPEQIDSGAKIPVQMDGQKARYVLLWITRLAVDIEDPNRFRARIGEVKIAGDQADIAAAPSAGE